MNLSTKITAFLIEQNIVSKKNKEVYEYGFDLLIADFINFSTILLIGVLCCRPWPTVLYLTIFVGLRSVCGGCINRSESSICTDFQLHFHGLKPHQE